jgi:hypothetical protein
MTPIKPIPIPQCYRRPFKNWLRSEYARAIGVRNPSEPEINQFMKLANLHITPVISQTHMVFAVCRNDSEEMIRAIKIPRVFNKADAAFITSVLAISQ